MTEQRKVAVELGGVAETLLWNLYQRACEARRPDAVLRDPEAVAPAETIGYPFRERFGRGGLGQWRVVSAGQCWHWFDRRRAAAEARRLLAAGGVLAICYRDYVVAPGNVCAASEELVLAHNPGWAMGGWTGMPAGWRAELGEAGFASWRRSVSA